jgi:hypothetical protein
MRFRVVIAILLVLLLPTAGLSAVRIAKTKGSFIEVL